MSHSIFYLEFSVNGVKFNDFNDSNDIYQTQSNFISLEAVKALLAEMLNRSDLENIKVRVEIITNNPQSQTDYQAICDPEAYPSGNRAI